MKRVNDRRPPTGDEIQAGADTCAIQPNQTTWIATIAASTGAKARAISDRSTS
jgi:hypothetical protein